MTLDRNTLFIDGAWATPAGSELIEVVSPHTEEVVATRPGGHARPTSTPPSSAARRAFDQGPWPRMSPEERIEVVQTFANLYAGRIEEMADVITTEMGSPTSFSNLAQSPAPWMMIESFIGIAKAFPWEETRPGALGSDVIVRREPVGVVAAIPPWNVPQFTTISKVAPALLAGCTVVLKPAPETPLDSYLMAELLAEAGVPAGVVNIVAAGREVGEHLVAHPGIDKVAFTGSTAAGRKIAAVCGEQLKRVSLELGGKSAAIVLDDADLAATMEGLRFTALMNSGQACVAQTRILASRRRYDEVVDALAADRRQRCRWATPPTRRPRSARWSRSASRSGWRSTSRSARRRAPASSSAATGCPTASTTAGTSAPPCSPTWTTRCGSRRRRSSGRCSR